MLLTFIGLFAAVAVITALQPTATSTGARAVGALPPPPPARHRGLGVGEIAYSLPHGCWCRILAFTPRQRTYLVVLQLPDNRLSQAQLEHLVR
jgi:hypothetical protein